MLKNRTFLQKVAGTFEGIKKGFGDLKKSLSEGFTTLTGGSGLLGKFVRGTLFTGLIFAIGNFLQSDTFKEK